MRRIEIEKEISGKTDIELRKVSTVIETFFTAVKEHLVNNDPVSLRGLGRFSLKSRAAKVARNIHKNIAVDIPAHNIPFFKPSKEFRIKVKGL